MPSGSNEYVHSRRGATFAPRCNEEPGCNVDFRAAGWPCANTTAGPTRSLRHFGIYYGPFLTFSMISQLKGGRDDWMRRGACIRWHSQFPSPGRCSGIKGPYDSTSRLSTRHNCRRTSPPAATSWKSGGISKRAHRCGSRAPTSRSRRVDHPKFSAARGSRETPQSPIPSLTE